jgi:hypothetical protein
MILSLSTLTSAEKTTGLETWSFVISIDVRFLEVRCLTQRFREVLLRSGLPISAREGKAPLLLPEDD